MRVRTNRIKTSMMQGNCINPDYSLNDNLSLQKTTVEAKIIQLNQQITALNIDLAFATKKCQYCSGILRRKLDHWKTVFPQLQHIPITIKKYFEGEFIMAVMTKISGNLIPTKANQLITQQNLLLSIDQDIISNNTLISNAEIQKSACEQQNLADMQIIQAQLLLEEQLRQQGVTATGKQIIPEEKTSIDNQKLYLWGGGIVVIGGMLYFNRKKIFK